MMSSTKICTIFFIVLAVCESWLVVAAPVKWAPSEPAASQQGDAVLFFASFQGQLRDIEYNPIIFNQVLVNQGSGYSNEDGVFTAPVAGIYQFVFGALICRGDHNNVWYFMVNGNRSMACAAQVVGTDTVQNTCYLMEELKKGDRVWMKQNSGSCAWASSTSKTITFSGVLLASEGVSTVGNKFVQGNSCPLPHLGQNKPKVSGAPDQRAALCSVAISLLLHTLLF